MRENLRKIVLTRTDVVNIFPTGNNELVVWTYLLRQRTVVVEALYKLHRWWFWGPFLSRQALRQHVSPQPHARCQEPLLAPPLQSPHGIVRLSIRPLSWSVYHLYNEYLNVTARALYSLLMNYNHQICHCSSHYPHSPKKPKYKFIYVASVMC